MVNNTETKTDNAQTPQGSGQTSQGGQDTSQESPTHTDAQAKKMVGDALAQAGRDAKGLEDKHKVIDADRKALDAERADWQRARDTADAETYKDDPDAFKALQTKRDLQRREDEVKRREGVADEREKEFGAASRTTRATDIANELGIDCETLLKHGGETEDSMRDLAKMLPKTVTTTQVATLKVDSGSSSGDTSTGPKSPMDAALNTLARLKNKE